MAIYKSDKQFNNILSYSKDYHAPKIALWKQKCVWEKGLRRSFHVPCTCETFYLMITNQIRWRSYWITTALIRLKLIASVTPRVLKCWSKYWSTWDMSIKSQYLWDLNWWMNPFWDSSLTHQFYKTPDYLQTMETSNFN